MTNTLDPGYAAAARRRSGQPRRHWYDRPAVALGCLLIGFTLMVAYLQTHRSAPAAAKVHDSLVSRVHTAQKQDTALAKQLETLDGQLTAARNRALPGARGLLDELTADQLAAGQVAVTGPGLQVQLREPPAAAVASTAARNGTTPQSATNILTDRDVQSVVNELWADGAEAIAVNGVRLTPTAAIRFAGDAVLVDYQPVTSPYLIRAIGDGQLLDTTFAASAVASRYQTLVSADGIGFSFTEEHSLSLAASGPTTLRYARVPTPSPARKSLASSSPARSAAPRGAVPSSSDRSGGGGR